MRRSTCPDGLFNASMCTPNTQAVACMLTLSSGLVIWSSPVAWIWTLSPLLFYRVTLCNTVLNLVIFPPAVVIHWVIDLPLSPAALATFLQIRWTLLALSKRTLVFMNSPGIPRLTCTCWTGSKAAPLVLLGTCYLLGSCSQTLPCPLASTEGVPEGRSPWEPCIRSPRATGGLPLPTPRCCEPTSPFGLVLILLGVEALVTLAPTTTLQ